MIVYSGNKNKFISDVKENSIHKKILSEFERKIFKRPSPSEIDSWKNSMEYMFKILIDPEIPDDAGVSIEYMLPLTSKRVDFILTGRDAEKRDTAVIVELKQWSKVNKTSKDAVVKTFLGKGERETSHPSYQAWTYAALIEDYNETVRKEDIALKPCAYLHNLDSPEAINDPFYQEHINKAPVFISSDAAKLADFLKKHVKYGDTNDIMYRIEHGKIKPSRALADSLVSMVQGGREFLMIDDQKLVYEQAISLAHKAQKKEKQVLIVSGGPGTGKSVVAINLLVELTSRGMVAQYVSKNAAPRSVYAAKLTGTLKRTKINNMFKGSGSYIDVEPDFFGALIVDEAHRLNEKSGLYQNQGEHQVKEIIAASRFSIFFIDEYQRVTLKDVGSAEEIERWADHFGAKVHRMELQSQFRCNGSDGYLAWIDNALQVRETVNKTLEELDYDFRVFDSPKELMQEIVEKNRVCNKARVVAGYCWDWKSKKQHKEYDIVFPEHGFKVKWNLMDDGSLWIVSPDSVQEIGCIHTCQGLEVDYIGVIIGPDFLVRDGDVVTDGSKRSSGDNSVKGIRGMLKTHPVKAKKLADEIIKNTYRTLMTRGQKGCFIYCTDKETNDYFKNLLANSENMYHTLQQEMQVSQKYPGLDLPVFSGDMIRPYVNAVPLYDLRAAAGDFSEYQVSADFDWVQLPDGFAPKPGYFVVRIVGASMNNKIPDGAWCLFKPDAGGSRNGKTVLVQHRDIQDPDMGDCFTVKNYYSEKQFDEAGDWKHKSIMLKPNSTDLSFMEMVFTQEAAGSLKVIGEFIAVIS